MTGDFVDAGGYFATMIAHWWVLKVLNSGFRAGPRRKKEEVIWTGSAWADVVPAPEISGAFSFTEKYILSGAHRGFPVTHCPHVHTIYYKEKQIKGDIKYVLFI